MNQLQYFLASLGSRKERRLALDLALGTSELPGKGWWMKDQRVLRTASTMRGRPEDGPVFERARKAGGFGVNRLFTQRDPYLEVTMGVAKYPSAADAQFVVGQANKIIRPKPSAPAKLLGERVKRDIDVLGVDACQTIEWDTSGPLGIGVVCWVAASIGAVYFLISYASIGEVPPWCEVLQLCERQVAKIRSHSSVAESTNIQAQP